MMHGAMLAAALQMWAASDASAAAGDLHGLVDPPSTEHHVGKFIFAELVTPNLAAAKQFYGGLFGWNFQDIQTGPTAYSEAMSDGHPVAGLTQRDVGTVARRQPAWLGFIAVSDIDSMRKSALLNGAKLLAPPRAMPNRGQWAVFADPQGAVFGVLASSTGDPPDVLPENGEWIWRSLMTSNPDTDAAFYQKVFDYEVYELPADGGQGQQHFILATEDYARASANTAPPVAGGSVHPHWLNFIRVDDANKSAARAVELGGKVLVSPRMDRHGGMVAVVADPQGAPVGLLEWPNDQDKKAAP